MADKINDGGPAFPTIDGPQTEYLKGMSLRDYIATRAMPELIRFEGDRLPFIEVAEMAYEMADAMLLARQSATTVPQGGKE